MGGRLLVRVATNKMKFRTQLWLNSNPEAIVSGKNALLLTAAVGKEIARQRMEFNGSRPPRRIDHAKCTNQCNLLPGSDSFGIIRML